MKSTEIARSSDDGPYARHTASATIQAMTSHRTIRRRQGARRLANAIEARRQLNRESRGRAWINGREVGGLDPRYAHLARSYD